MFADFQEAIVLVAGDTILTVANFTLAGAVILAGVWVFLAGLRHYLS